MTSSRPHVIPFTQTLVHAHPHAHNVMSASPHARPHARTLMTMTLVSRWQGPFQTAQKVPQRNTAARRAVLVTTGAAAAGGAREGGMGGVVSVLYNVHGSAECVGRDGREERGWGEEGRKLVAEGLCS